MRRSRIAGLLLLVAVGCPAGALAQVDDPNFPPTPPPTPPRPPRNDASGYKPILEDSKLPWQLPPELYRSLQEKTEVYRDFAIRFTCDELARVATYKGGDEATKERARRYAYLIVRENAGIGLRELRQELSDGGQVKSGEIRDEDPFPPAYAWVFLFSRQNEGHFDFRYVGERFDGFDWVHEIQFRGSLPFTDGKDIREWEGVVLIDAPSRTPLEIRAEPARQSERLEEVFREWAKSFQIMGLHMAKSPNGYQARIQFRERRSTTDDNQTVTLTFPTEIRYDKFRAVGAAQVAPISATTRTYSNYRFFKPTVVPELGDVAPSR
ncbi:MAG TPA: hypothetical protein VJS92_09475 [Candidatus Polarisedimenticolaceae bacterium]|nr:hypothetical protein [Candidatus Polarisedimenticolaceae bacterium]